MGTRSSDIALGREGLLYFHNQAIKYPAYKFQFEQLIDAARGENFLEGFGFAIEQVGLSSSELEKTMKALADSGQGKIPASSNAWFKALSDEAQNINWVTAAPSVALGVAKQAVEGLAEGGESIITGLKSLNVVLPLLIFGGVLYVVISRIKKAA